jgi:Beta/Gamma crystallin
MPLARNLPWGLADYLEMTMTTGTLKIFAGLALIAGLAGGAAVAAAPDSTHTSITVYDQPNFRGQSLTFERGVPSLARLGFNDKVASVRISGSRDWVLCEHRNFMGKCVRIHSKAKDLKRQGIVGQVSSLYPVPADQPKQR